MSHAWITEPTYYRWKAKYRGVELNEMQRLKLIEAEKAGLEERSMSPALTLARNENPRSTSIVANFRPPLAELAPFRYGFGTGKVRPEGVSRR